jgi:oxygen-independent coproporphyrinogen-3 oxidase
MWRAGRIVLPDEDTAAGLYDTTQELCDAAGLPAYEISNHAAPGAECRQNLVYWRGAPYAGIGPGAHGRLILDGAVTATRQRRKPEDWLAAVAADGHGMAEEETVAPADRAMEIMMMGLRLAEGVSLATLRDQTGLSLEDVVNQRKFDALRDAGLVVCDDAHLRLTPAGRRVLDAVLPVLLS